MKPSAQRWFGTAGPVLQQVTPPCQPGTSLTHQHQQDEDRQDRPGSPAGAEPAVFGPFSRGEHRWAASGVLGDGVWKGILALHPSPDGGVVPPVFLQFLPRSGRGGEWAHGKPPRLRAEQQQVVFHGGPRHQHLVQVQPPGLGVRGNLTRARQLGHQTQHVIDTAGTVHPLHVIVEAGHAAERTETPNQQYRREAPETPGGRVAKRAAGGQANGPRGGLPQL